VRSDRRQFLQGLGAAPFALATGLSSAAARVPSPRTVPDFPNAGSFQSGDFLWPKKKGAFVPRTRSAGPPSQERRTWEAERERALADPAATGVSPEVAEKLKAMRFEDFERVYYTGPAQPQGEGPVPGQSTRGLGPLGDTVSVGHVGIIEVAEHGIPYVIEATPSGPGGAGGVIRTRYADWLENYSNIQVWHGRTRDLPEAMRRRVLDVALSQVGKPYDFFNFNLNDDRGFYCSKLVWMSLWRAASIAADDTPDPRRGATFPPWFSPKQLISAKRIDVLHKPGEY